jgi:hypothetical protein
VETHVMKRPGQHAPYYIIFSKTKTALYEN